MGRIFEKFQVSKKGRFYTSVEARTHIVLPSSPKEASFARPTCVSWTFSKFLFILLFNLHQSLPRKQVFCEENHYFEKGGCILRTTGVIFASAFAKSSLFAAETLPYLAGRILWNG